MIDDVQTVSQHRANLSLGTLQKHSEILKLNQICPTLTEIIHENIAKIVGTKQIYFYTERIMKSILCLEPAHYGAHITKPSKWLFKVILGYLGIF